MAVVLVTGDKDAAASPVNHSVEISDKNDESPTPTPNSPSKEEARSEIQQMRQKLLQQQEEFQRTQQEIEEEAKAIIRQTNDSDEEKLQPLHQHLVNSAYTIASPVPSPKFQQQASFH